MVETEWPKLGGTKLQYSTATTREELTGTVEIAETGDVLAVEAKQVDDVRGRKANLRFGLQYGTPSLNPGNLGSHFDRLEREGDRQYLVVKTEPQTYRYELRGLEYE